VVEKELKAEGVNEAAGDNPKQLARRVGVFPSGEPIDGRTPPFREEDLFR
jgi:hypothetical protein